MERSLTGIKLVVFACISEFSKSMTDLVEAMDQACIHSCPGKTPFS